MLSHDQPMVAGAKRALMRPLEPVSGSSSVSASDDSELPSCRMSPASARSLTRPCRNRQKCSVIFEQNPDRSLDGVRVHAATIVRSDSTPTQGTPSICRYAVRMYARALVVTLSVATLGCECRTAHRLR